MLTGVGAPNSRTIINLPVSFEQHDASHTQGHTCTVSSRPQLAIDAFRGPQHS